MKWHLFQLYDMWFRCRRKAVALSHPPKGGATRCDITAHRMGQDAKEMRHATESLKWAFLTRIENASDRRRLRRVSLYWCDKLLTHRCRRWLPTLSPTA